jgi:hypothetical protein
MRSSSLFSPMAAVRRPSPHRSLAAVLLSLRALTGKPGSSGREEGCREGERRKAMGGSTVAARRDMRSLSPSSFPLVMPSSLAPAAVLLSLRLLVRLHLDVCKAKKKCRKGTSKEYVTFISYKEKTDSPN